MRFRAVLLAAWVGWNASPAILGAQEPPPPIFGERSLHLLHVPFLDFGPSDAGSPEPGRLEWTEEIAEASTFSSSWHATSFHRDLGLLGRPFTGAEARAIHSAFPEDGVFLLESDLLREALTVRVGLAPQLSISAEIVYVSHDAIHAGSAIEAFHRAFGFRDSGRSEFPADAFYAVLQKPGGEIVFDDRAPASGFGDTTAKFSWRPARAGHGWRGGADVAVKAPTGSSRDFNGSGSWDAGALGFVRRDGVRWTVDGEAGWIFPGRWKSSAGLGTAPFARVLVGASRRFGQRTWVGASSTVEQSPFRREKMGALSDPGWELALGVEHRFLARWAASVTLTENTPYWKSRADVGVALKFRVW